jgi:uridine kinase
MRVEKLRDLVARLHARPRRRLTLLVAVDGLGGAGKTTFTRALVALDPGLDVIQMADFMRPRDELLQEAADQVAGDVDWRRLRSNVLLPLSRDQPGRYQRYDPATDSLAEWRMVPVGGIVIVEGLYSCSRPLSTFYDFRIWVDSPGASRTPQPAEDAYVEAQNPASSAHLRIDGSGAVPHDPAREYVRV